MKEIVIETLIDTARTMPYLFVIYIFLEVIQKKIKNLKIESVMLNRFAPLIGSLVGCFPQCGFSSAAATLYTERLIKTGTLISVFLATSDEAIPVLISSNDSSFLIFYVILSKLIIAIVTGYILNYTIFKNEKYDNTKKINVCFNSCECESHHHKDNIKIFSILKNAMYHTIKISLYILVTLFIIDVAIHFIGEAKMSKILFSGNKIVQPIISALIGIIPGCSISVFLSELLMKKQIFYGSAIAGLSTNAGFAYIILFKSLGVKKTLKIILIVFVAGSTFGILLNNLLQY